MTFPQTIVRELETMRARVEAVLARSELARDNDTVLQLELLRDYLRSQGYDMPELPAEIWRVIANFKFESVRRVRQKIQEEGKYPSSPQVEARRHQKQEVMRDWAGQKIKPGSWE